MAELKLTPEMQKLFVEEIRNGIPAEHICPLAGITKTTYYNWIAKGKKEDEGVYRDFFDAISGAKSEFLATLVKMLTNHLRATNDEGKLDPYLALRILGLRDRENWGEKVVNEHQGAITVVRSNSVERPKGIEDKTGEDDS